MNNYLDKIDYVIHKIRFNYLGTKYQGRGVLMWNPDNGFLIEAPMDSVGGPSQTVFFGGSGIIKKDDLVSIKMRWSSPDSWIILPDVIMRDEIELELLERLSLKANRAIISNPSNVTDSQNWSGSALFEVKGKAVLPDQIVKEIYLGEERIGKSYSLSGIQHNGPDGETVIGRLEEGKYIKINYSLPRKRWNRNEAWKWAEAAKDSLSILLGQTVRLLRRKLVRGKREYTEIRKCNEVKNIRPFAPFSSETHVNRERFIKLTDFFVKDNLETVICRKIFQQMVAVSQQKSWQARELLLSTILEATLRTYQNHPFKEKDTNFKLRQAYNSFCKKYFTEEWTDICTKAFLIHFKLRHRNAHPDWLFEQTGYLSDKRREESLNDMIFMSRFYGYMILALAGFDNLKPKF